MEVNDKDCVEYWEIKCETVAEVSCLISTVDDSCLYNDMRCGVNFLRAFCDKFEDEAWCSTALTKRALNKVGDCVPGDWGCPGF